MVILVSADLDRLFAFSCSDDETWNCARRFSANTDCPTVRSTTCMGQKDWWAIPGVIILSNGLNIQLGR
jgi:hypothetical protein